MSGLDVQEYMLIEQIVTNEAPSAGVAYLLLIFLGLLSGHRFYLGRPGSAVVQIISYFFAIGFLWLILDLFLIPGMVRNTKDKIRQREMVKLLARGRPAAESPQPQPPVSQALIDSMLASEAKA